jgi:hypothetical protein
MRENTPFVARRLDTRGWKRSALTAAAIFLILLAHTACAAASPRIGDAMPDGTVYAGVSPDTGTALYVAPADAPALYTFSQARDYAAALNAYGHRDWRVPTRNELNILFAGRAVIGGFNVMNSDPPGWYWSSSPSLHNTAWGQRFSDGWRRDFYANLKSEVRLVR